MTTQAQQDSITNAGRIQDAMESEGLILTMSDAGDVLGAEHPNRYFGQINLGDNVIFQGPASRLPDWWAGFQAALCWAPVDTNGNKL